MRGTLTIVLLSALMLTGCTSMVGGKHDSATNVPMGGGILSQLRPKIDPRFVEKAKEDEMARLANQAAQAQAMQQSADQQSSMDGMGRVLPQVVQDPISSQVSGQMNEVASASVPPSFDAGAAAAAAAAAAASGSGGDVWAAQEALPPDQAMLADARKGQAASYGAYGGGTVPPPPPGSLTPPPPAVTLSTQAAMPGAEAGAYAQPYAQPYVNPYANPYLNPYAVPYPAQYPMMAPQQAQPERPAGLFGSGQAVPRQRGGDDMQPERRKTSFIPITPTGMEARSPYKQRDDLKVLWKGAITSGSMGGTLSRDEKLAADVNRLDVSLPGEATKGSFSVGQRQIDQIFKPVVLDKRIATQVRRLQADLVQSYYRYLYTYNKFALAQQTSAARKQEAEVAETDSEKQRALADQAQAQNEADSAREDMKTAQMELASAAGANAARTIIGRVSGITPTAESISQPEPAQPMVAEAKGMFGLPTIGSMWNMVAGTKPKQPAAEGGDMRAAAMPLPAKGVAAPPADSGKKTKGPSKKAKSENAAGSEKSAEKAGDLSPSPQVAQAPQAGSPSPAEAAPPAPSNGVSVELKGVSITARKSTLSVVVKNSGQGDFTFSTDDFSVAENNRKLSDAAMRADFDTTIVQPNQEVKGTITIFGRPWSDRLNVSLSDGARMVQMRR